MARLPPDIQHKILKFVSIDLLEEKLHLRPNLKHSDYGMSYVEISIKDTNKILKIYADDVGQSAFEAISVSGDDGWKLLDNSECTRGCVWFPSSYGCRSYPRQRISWNKGSDGCWQSVGPYAEYD